MTPRSHSPQTLDVLHALAREPDAWRHGYDLALELGLKSGSLYPILIRLSDRRLLDSRWETAEAGRPPRHVYRLTAEGLTAAAGSPTRVPTTGQRRRPELGRA